MVANRYFWDARVRITRNKERTLYIRFEKCGKVGGLYSLARLFAIYSELREVESPSSITHPAGSLTEIYTYTLLHALPTGIYHRWCICVRSVSSYFIHIAALLLSIFAKDGNVQLFSRQTITSFHFTRTHFMLIFILLSSLISSNLHFFDFTQRLMWIWYCQTIINFLECPYYINTGKVSDSDHLSWSNRDTRTD